ncbi:MAG TPA: hypothetical protein VGV38_07330, partial [Pyrinomonadaceae bacterium]|nr:hypothetical protein [Pyrinomonadaceae bacterium]
AEALQALAGPSTGATGEGEIFLDGFSGGRLPPKESIREIRINRNPFSAEYDRLGYGRIEIFTKPGTDRLRGSASFNFNDESLNSRHPFALTRAPFQSRRYSANLSGPIVKGKASFFLDFERRETDDNDVINAIILDPATLQPVGFNESVLAPVRRTTFSPRLDYQLNQTNTLVVRYSYERGRRENSGLNDLSLPSRAFDTFDTEHTLQLTETAVINQKVINETRFQYRRDRSRQEGDDFSPTVRVLEAFIGGGSQVGLSSNAVDRYELSNHTSWAAGTHSLKAGARLRGVRIKDITQSNFGGTFTFAGGTAPQLNAAGQIVTDASGNPLLVPITSFERYRRTIVFLPPNCGGAGRLPCLSGEEIRARGGGPTQFSIAGGEPEATVSRVDFGPFFQDDWRLRPNFTLSLGLRYETQTNIDSNLNFAPRVAFAWSPGANAQGRSSTVVRGGFGVFYERFAENLTLQATRFNGERQQQFVITGATEAGADVLEQFPNVPTVAELTAFQIRQTVRQVDPTLQAPYTMQVAMSVERQLPARTSLSVSYIAARTLHVLRARNVNAPLPGTVDATGRGGVRPFPELGNVFQYESTGRFNQHQLIVSGNTRFGTLFTLFGNYVLN